MDQLTRNAAVGLSFSLCVVEALQRQTGEKPTGRRYRKLQKAINILNEALDCFPGQMPRELYDHAARVFDLLEAEMKREGGAE